MDAAVFIVVMIKVLTWSAAVVFILILFRQPLIRGRSFLRARKYKRFSVKFGKAVSSEKERIEAVDINESEKFEQGLQALLEISEKSPRAAVIESWASLQDTLLRISLSAGQVYSMENYRDYSRVGHTMLNLDAFTTTDLQRYHRLKKLRNKTAAMPEFVIDTEDAKVFVGLLAQLSLIALARAAALKSPSKRD